MSLFGCDHGPLIAQLRDECADLRRTIDRERGYHAAFADREQAAFLAERARYDALLQTVLAMKQAGATVEPIFPTPEQAAKITLDLHRHFGPAAEPDDRMWLCENCGVYPLGFDAQAHRDATGHDPVLRSRSFLGRAEPDELVALIDVQCGRDYRKRAMMLAQLKTDRAGGMDPEAIRAAIVNGVRSEGVPT